MSDDANGQMVSRTNGAGTTRYRYTPQGELLAVVVPSGDSIFYTLDPAGRRVARSLNGVVTNRWLWDGALRPVAEVDAAGNVLTRYVYGTNVNVPNYLVRSGVTYRIVKDHLGSVRLVVNAATGAVVSRLEYGVWGNVTSSVNPSFQPFGFAGGFREDATGLTHFGAREYAPELGRWTRKDPIGFNGGLSNLYGYVGNDPVNWADHDGLAGEDLIRKRLNKDFTDAQLSPEDKATVAKFSGDQIGWLEVKTLIFALAGDQATEKMLAERIAKAVKDSKDQHLIDLYDKLLILQAEKLKKEPAPAQCPVIKK